MLLLSTPPIFYPHGVHLPLPWACGGFVCIHLTLEFLARRDDKEGRRKGRHRAMLVRIVVSDGERASSRYLIGGGVDAWLPRVYQRARERDVQGRKAKVLLD